MEEGLDKLSIQSGWASVCCELSDDGHKHQMAWHMKQAQGGFPKYAIKITEDGIAYTNAKAASELNL